VKPSETSSVPFRVAVLALVSTWVLLLIGGTVNPMGASLACPDWYFVPTCNGELFPEMTGGVLYEHGHRLWASWVGVITIALGTTIWLRRREDVLARRVGIAAVVLVCLQGALGGITVLVGLSAAISTLHLATAMLFFSMLVFLCFRLAPKVSRAAGMRLQPTRRGLIVSAALAVLMQIVLGGLVRHLGGGLICGDDWLGCGAGTEWVAQPLAHLHMTHRAFGFALIPLVVFAAKHTRREAVAHRIDWAARIAWLPMYLVLVQVGLGLATVATGRSVALVTLHTGVGALVLATLVAAFFALGPEGQRLRSRDRAGVGEGDR
jgi:heme A synthase